MSSSSSSMSYLAVGKYSTETICHSQQVFLIRHTHIKYMTKGNRWRGYSLGTNQRRVKLVLVSLFVPCLLKSVSVD